MSDSGRRSDEPGLFDLPLRPEDDGDEAETPASSPSSPRSPRRAPSSDLPLFPEADDVLAEEREDEPAPAPARPRPTPVPDPDPEDAEPEDSATETHEPAPDPTPRRATPGRRWLGGGLDVLTLLGAGLALILGSALLGGRVGWSEMLPLGLFLLLFSFAYTVIPLAFWGQTPGMKRAGLVARSGPSDPLTFGQTALRWLGGVLTVVTLGLPTLWVLFGGRSLTDRLSDSDTYQMPR